ncbi:dihydrofolate reductase family protein [Leifsonia sp. NPDC058292]|uniref:dihydrofolate reductase family protein n=1 Tax=Leifsonia sp. NPDC058292 TaxID=3346428 RepID=UPI0036D97F20
MGLVISDMSISLDGYVAGPNDSRENPFGDGAESLHAWLHPTATDEDRAVLERAVKEVGAIVMGRKSFEKNEGDGGWGNAGPMGDVPCLVLTHRAPTHPYPETFTFVTDGIVSAIARARQLAGEKDVHLFGATALQQALPLDLVDEIRVHVMPMLLGGGTALFGSLESAIALERIEAQVTATATHLTYRVRR